MKLLATSLLILLSVVHVAAQTTNNQSILGTVEDSSGAAVPNAVVSVVNEDTKLSRSATSNQSGNYVIADLPIGFYDVSAVAQGFKKFVLTKVNVSVGQQATVNVTLQLGDVNQSVSVQADAVRVESSSGEVSNLITGTQASNIQLNGRNFPQLLQLLPGVSTTYSSGFSLFGGYGVNNSGQSI
ncbi:MAG TPA: carboxypeptidase-like regulatory domain-containing protein, partial [Bryobacteraceae bacterium]